MNVSSYKQPQVENQDRMFFPKNKMAAFDAATVSSHALWLTKTCVTVCTQGNKTGFVEQLFFNHFFFIYIFSGNVKQEGGIQLLGNTAAVYFTFA